MTKRTKAVYTIVERPGKPSVWVHIGWAFANGDGSLDLRLDALPLNGRIQVRDWTAIRDAEATP